VSAGGTGYTEAVRVEFDPARVSYAQLLEKFWPTIDPTVKDQQFCDVGSQYRTGIYPLNEQQLKAATASKAALEKTKPFRQPIVGDCDGRDVPIRPRVPPGLLLEPG
jgi:peptide-methionine (S)-S-oxide reductase